MPKIKVKTDDAETEIVVTGSSSANLDVESIVESHGFNPDDVDYHIVASEMEKRIKELESRLDDIDS